LDEYPRLILVELIRKNLRKHLRGPLRRWWVLRKYRRLDKAYIKKLAGETSVPEIQSPTPRVFSITRPGNSLQSILFIADCMWEKNELVPELEKIAPVTTLDLRPSLEFHADTQPNHHVVLEAVREFLRLPTHSEPNVILFYARSLLLSEEVFALLRKRWQAPLFGMNLDDKIEFFDYGVFSAGNDNYQLWARQFDLNLTSSVTALNWYQRQGLPAHYLAMGFHPSAETAEPPVSARFERPISFVGSCKPERERIVKALKDARIPIALFGNGWPDGRWIEKSASIYRSSQLNLGVGFATASGGIGNLKARDFECPGSGACYLTTYNWELALHYDIGKEILCYRSTEELLEMYFHYSKRPEECLRIAQAAHRRCAAEHTWERRFRKVFREVGFKV
jgi:hypothetical protein